MMSRDDLAEKYFAQLPYTPYPVQEDALLQWFSTDTGVLVCAPTGTGKTLIAEAAAFEALHTGRTMYYTTPLIALTEQKFRELQACAVRWGFSETDVGLVTGNRRENPDAKVLVVVAEILLNRLLHVEAFDFSQVFAVVMDEFHSFSDPERGIVWEFALSLLPKSVRLLLLSATIGNAIDFLLWLERCHGRRLELAQSSDRKVPLNFRWIPDQLLNEFLEDMAQGDAETRKTPALVFCFNRDECWRTAEELKGKQMLSDGQQKQLVAQLNHYDWTKGVGPKLKQLLMRGVGVHHAGLLPKYKRIVEDLFQKKLLTICVCTETLAAGINLPARSVVMPCLLKGKPGEQKVIDPSSAHQIFGRAGRPQFDKEGFVFALPHEDDVQILRWKRKYDQIPEDTKDPNLIRAKKALKKKQPTRSPDRQYWTEQQFEKLRTSPPGNLMSRGQLPWRLLAYLLQLSPDVDRLRNLLRKRLMDAKQLDIAEKELERMLLTLHAGDFVKLEPEPPQAESKSEPDAPATVEAAPQPAKVSWLSQELQKALDQQRVAQGLAPAKPQAVEERPRYRPIRATPTEKLEQLFVFRSINPVFGMYVLPLLAQADQWERLQIWESVLELPRNLLKFVRVPPPRILPPGPLATGYVDQEVVARGLLSAGDLYPEFDPDVPFEERKYPVPLADKLKLLFDAEYPHVHSLFITPVWVAGELLNFGGDFNKYIGGSDLAKQEGLIFRHLLRLVLLIGEFAQLTPPGLDPSEWQRDLRELAVQISESCRAVDPTSTDYALQHAADPDLVTLDKPTTPAISILEPHAAAPESATEPDPYADWPDPESL
jgi:superfamily II DNA/RNA helicase